MWPVFDFLLGAYGVNSGHVNLLTPEGSAEELEIPESLSMVDERVCTAVHRIGDKSRMYVAGGMTDNTMITEQRHFLRQFIAPMSEQLIESAAPATGQIGFEKVAAAAGLNGACIFYLRWRDSLHGRRSPFSGATPTITMAGASSLVIRQVPLVPTPNDYGVDQIEVWVNRNGESLNGEPVIRLLAVRDSGAPTLTITEYVEGEAETASNLQQAPRCRFNLVYHNRLWQWGNEQNPDRAFGSVLNRLDEYGGLYLGTLNGDPITAGVVVRDTMVLFTPRSSYYVQGYSTSDLKVKILEPDVGCINHFGIQMIDDIAIIPTHRGLYACTGTGMSLISGDYTQLWIALYNAEPSRFNNGFAVNDKASGVYKFYEQTLVAPRYWVLDYSTFSPLEGGSFSPPLLSFDKHASKDHTCAAMLSKPYSKESSCYTATLDGLILLENRWDLALDYTADITVIIQPFMLTEDGGGHDDGMMLHEMWFFISNHGNTPDTFDLRIQNGNEWAALYEESVAFTRINTTAFLLSVPTSNDGKAFTTAVGNPIAFQTPAGGGDTHFPQTLVLGNLNLAGEGFSPRITVVSPERLVYRGFGANVAPGKKKLHLANAGA